MTNKTTKLFIGMILLTVVMFSFAGAVSQNPSPSLCYCGDGVCGATENCNTCLCDCGTCPVPVCHIELTKSMSKTNALPNDIITYTLKYKNTGNAACTGGGVKIQDTLNGNLNYRGSFNKVITGDSDGQGLDFSWYEIQGYDSLTNTLTWNAHVVSPGEEGTITFEVKVLTPSQCGNFTIPNYFKAWSNQEDWKNSNTIILSVKNDCPPQPKCGDGVVNQANETCDDGNNANGDGCSSICKTEFCGDNVCNNYETCSTCTCDCGICAPVCGNGVKEANEECDLGGLNGNVCTPLYDSSCTYCSAQCTNITLTDGYCGNGIEEDSEECDLGGLNGVACTPSYGGVCSYCSSQCGEIILSDGYCGDGITQTPQEQCDDGNTYDDDGCSSTCQHEEQKHCIENISIRKSYDASYGTGIAIGYENGTWISQISPDLMKGLYKARYYVDNNVANTTNNAHITVKIDGSALLDYNYLIKVFHSRTLTINTSALQCNSMHKVSVKVDSECNFICTQDNEEDNYVERSFFVECETPRCGDGNIDAGEQCDDGNIDDDDGCSASCHTEENHFCGDHVIDTNLGEECDKGSLWNGNGCTPLYGSSCTYCSEQCKNITLTDGYCGDSIRQPQYEDCDKGTLNGQVCTPLYDSSCTYCNDSCKNITLTDGHCGDGIMQANEQCDDSNNANDDGCSSTCKTERCGDGVQQANEWCDDSNTANNDGCSSTCKIEFCGDSIKQANEQCDDGNTNNLDSCRNDCKLAVCGDSIKDKNEYCDDGNTENGDGCSKTCRFECPDGICTPNITIEKFPPQVWQCDHRIMMDDATHPGRISEDGQTLVERINDYAFEGEQIQWRVLVLDKNGIEKVHDVYATVNGQIEANCKLDHVLNSEEVVEGDCNARIGEENITRVSSNTAAYYTCTLTVETSDSMYGQSDVTVEAVDLDGEIGTMAEGESWFLNPTVSLGVDGGVVFNSLRPGTSQYSSPIILTNNAEDGSGVLLDVFVSGTNFYDTSHSGAKCGTTNQLSLKQFSYYATNGAYSTSEDMQQGRTCDAEGYCHVNYGIGFNNPNPFYDKNEVIQAQKVGPYYTANLLAPGADMSLIFRVNIPEPCNGNFDSGHIYFWGEAV